jgi:DNA-binding response OmpR family regulator
MDFLKVLVVHRQDAMLHEIKLILGEFEPYLRLYHSGIDGLQAARLETFDLVFFGVDLPVITGFEMMRSVRNFSRNKNTPAFFITEKMEEGYEKLCRQLNIITLEHANLKEALYAVVANNDHSGKGEM